MKSPIQVVDWQSGEVVLWPGCEVTPDRFQHAVWAIEERNPITIMGTQGYREYAKGDSVYRIDYRDGVAVRIQLLGFKGEVLRP